MKYLLLATVAAFALLSPAHAKDEPLPNPTMGTEIETSLLAVLFSPASSPILS
jgi:hypothetical protein